jgi:flagellar transcriptional activator FlhD
LADLVVGLSPAQMLKMSASNMLLCCFRLDERVMLNMLGDYKKSHSLSAVSKMSAKATREAVAA